MDNTLTHRHHHHHLRGSQTSKSDNLIAHDNLATVPAFGLQVEEVEGKSILNGAAEEVSLHIAARLESTYASQRKKTDVKHLETLSSEAVEAYMMASMALASPQQLKDVVKRMLSGGDPAVHARQAFKQPTEQFLAFQYALKQGQRDGVAPKVLEALRESMDVWALAYHAKIRADINTIGAAAVLGKNREGIAEFQDTYHKLVLGEGSFSATLQKAYKLAGVEGNFGVVLKRLISALGHDVAALSPSRNPVQLQAVLSDLYRYEAAVTVLPRCEDLCKASYAS